MRNAAQFVIIEIDSASRLALNKQAHDEKSCGTSARAIKEKWCRSQMSSVNNATVSSRGRQTVPARPPGALAGLFDALSGTRGPLT